MEQPISSKENANSKKSRNNEIPVMNIDNQSRIIEMSEFVKNNQYQNIDNKNDADTSKNSSRTFREDLDDLEFLSKKYLVEKEKNYKLEAEKKTELFRAEQQKKLTKKLISFSENQKMRIIKIIDFFICFFVLCDISLSVYTNMRFSSDELDLNDKVYKEKFFTDQQIFDLRICIMCIVFLIEIFLIFKYHFQLKILRSALFASEQDNIFTTGLYKKMFLEMLIMLPFTAPDLKGYFSGNMLLGRYTYSIDSFILLVKISKLYYIVTVYTHISLWTSNTALDIAKDYKTSIGSNFILKATIKKSPTLSIVFMLILSVTLFSFMIRIFEYGFSVDNRDSEMASAKAIRNAQFGSYVDVVWVVIISMTTVGYGDIYPQTHMGRLVAFLSSIVGMIIQSLLIVRLSDFVELTVDEKKAYNEIKKLDDQNKLEQLSCVLIKSVFKLYRVKFDTKMSKKEK